jgi:hypothetical protein
MLMFILGACAGPALPAGHGPTAVPPPATTAGVSPTGTAAQPPACSLLTQAEAGRLTGVKVGAGVESGANGAATLCQYNSDPSGPTAQVDVIVGDGAKKGLDIDRDVLKHKFTPMTGLGDEAYQEDDNIFVRKGSVWAQVNLVLLNDPAQNVAPMQAAARQLLNRL